MDKYIVEIFGDSNDILSVRLEDIISLLPVTENIIWSILYIKAIGNEKFNGSVLDLENRVKASKNGYVINSHELMGLANSFSQIIEATILGDRNVENLRRYDEIEEARNNCDYVIELVDSSYWVVTANAEVVEIIKQMLSGVRNV